VALGFSSEWHPLSALTAPDGPPPQPPMRTLQLLGGRKEKIRAGDVLGALTKDLGFAGAQIGKITINDAATYVAVEAGIAADVLRRLGSGRIKGRSVKARLLET
jgi:ATP-independent RNA helicase DbpA